MATVPDDSIAADAREKSRLELDRVDQPEERPPGIGIRDDRLRVQFLAGASSVTPVARPVLHVDAAYFGPVRISAPAARAADASADVSDPSATSHEPLRAIARAHPHQQHRRAAGRSRSE